MVTNPAAQDSSLAELLNRLNTEVHAREDAHYTVSLSSNGRFYVKVYLPGHSAHPAVEWNLETDSRKFFVLESEGRSMSDAVQVVLAKLFMVTARTETDAA
ncbi:hypothetical protein [Rhodococcus sp. YH1]|uniref:hypothetical protein n=1 Tax=Rhodococcus sp. YH1 TaxID=89066 RepID=UPI0013871401|nr:hypothetical protein [Rhodococcus sp. YH1]